MTTTATAIAPEHGHLVRRFGYWVLTFVALLAYKWWTIRLPASWDASWTVIPGGVTLVESGFDLPALFNSPHFFDLGPATHGNSPVTWLTAVVMTVAGRGESLLPALHVVHLAIGAVLLRQIYIFGRSMWSPASSLALAIVTALIPVMNAQLGFIYLEVPQLTASMLAVNAFRSNQIGRAATWGALATAVKAPGIVTPLAMAATVVVLGRNRAAFRKGLLVSVPALVVAGAGALYLSTVTAVVDRSTSEVVFSAIGVLAGTPDVALICLIPLLFGYRTIKDGELGTKERQALVLSLWVIFGFLSLYLLGPLAGFAYNMLPRYLIQVVPFALVATTLTVRSVFEQRFLLVAAVVLVSFSLINSFGQFYPRSSLFNSVHQEQSLAYADILRLEQIGFEALEGRDDLPILVFKNQWFRGTYPEAGFVNSPLHNMEVITSDKNLPNRFIVLDTEDIDGFATNQLIESLSENPEWASQETEFSRGRFTIRLIEYTRR